MPYLSPIKTLQQLWYFFATHANLKQLGPFKSEKNFSQNHSNQRAKPFFLFEWHDKPAKQISIINRSENVRTCHCPRIEDILGTYCVCVFINLNALLCGRNSRGSDNKTAISTFYCPRSGAGKIIYLFFFSFFPNSFDARIFQSLWKSDIGSFLPMFSAKIKKKFHFFPSNDRSIIIRVTLYDDCNIKTGRDRVWRANTRAC